MTLDGSTDEALAARAQAGDRSAFNRLVVRSKTPLYSFIRRYVGSADDAYDVLQDTFISAWVGLRRYDPKHAFSIWIRTIALNKCRDFGRRRTVRKLVLDVFAREPYARSDPGASKVSETREDERLERLDTAISNLPPRYKEALLLTSLAGLSHQEAAEQLHLTPKAVEMRVYRARRLLAEQLGGPDD